MCVGFFFCWKYIRLTRLDIPLHSTTLFMFLNLASHYLVDIKDCSQYLDAVCTSFGLVCTMGAGYPALDAFDMCFPFF